jgi:Protein of unknown function (DUF3455)
MRRTILVKLFAAAASGMLAFTLGCAQNRNVAAPRSGPIQGQKQGSRCNTLDKDAFVLHPITKSNLSAALASNETLPPAIQVDTNRHKLLATRIGVGVQVYDHDSTNGRWAAREPQANLYDTETGFQRGIHFAGPFWTDADGSRVKAKPSGEVDAPVDAERNIKWLRLEAVENFGSNDDVLRQVTFIQRVLTYGGQPPSIREPAEGCDTVSVPYTALYVFWGQQEW